MKKLLLFLPFVLLLVAATIYPGGGGGTGSGTFNAASLTNWPNTRATNLTQVINARTTNFVDSFTVYWVVNQNLPFFALTSSGGVQMSNAVTMGPVQATSFEGDGSLLSGVTATLPAGVLTNFYTTSIHLSNSLTFDATNGTSIINFSNNNAGTLVKGSVGTSTRGNGIALYGYPSGIPTKLVEAYENIVLITNTDTLVIQKGGSANFVRVDDGLMEVRGSLLTGSGAITGNGSGITNIPVSGVKMSITSPVVVLTNTIYTNQTIDFAATATLTASDVIVSIANLKSNDIITVCPPASSQTNCGIFTGWISNSTAMARFMNWKATTVDPASGIFNVRVEQFR